MKSLLLAAALAGVSLSTAASATTSTLVVRSDAAALSDPKPRIVVQPTNLPRSFTGGVIIVEFSLDQAGRPREIQFPSAVDRQLAERVLQAFSQWQFETTVAGVPAAGRRFVLPLEIRPQE